jgi:NADH:ubiquinone oxidoreductase subunit C
VKKNNVKLLFVGMYLHKFLYHNISCVTILNKHIHIFVKDGCAFDILKFIKFDCFLSYTQLVDFIIVDKLEILSKSDYRFEYIYVLNSTVYNLRIFVRGFLTQFSFLMSAISLFNSIN